MNQNRAIEAPPAVRTLTTPRVEIERETRTYGRFAIGPLPPGFAQTVGTSLRRTLYNGLAGVAIASARIEGVVHEYQSIPGVVEQAADILLNCKGVQLNADHAAPMHPLILDVAGIGQATAADLQTAAGIEIVNPGLHIATLDRPSATLRAEFALTRGRGYAAASPPQDGELPVDSVFSPTLKANMRIAHADGAESATIEVWTTGAVSPTDAMREATAALVAQLAAIFEMRPPDAPEEAPRRSSTPIMSLNLDQRSLNALTRAQFATAEDVANLDPDDLRKIRGVGVSSFANIREQLIAAGLLTPDDWL